MTNIGTIGFIPYMVQMRVLRSVGSTYLRVDPIVTNEAYPDMQMWSHGARFDNLIFQQAFWLEMMEAFSGPKILDLCDPDWFQYEKHIIRCGRLVHAITCSSDSMARLLRQYFPEKIVEHVPDRYDFATFPAPRKKHVGKAKQAVWFGYTHNAHEVLGALVPSLKANNLGLRIVGNTPYQQEDSVQELKPEFIPYDRSNIYQILKESDILLNPRSDRAYFRYKSDNKSVVGWRLGLPVAMTNEDVDRLMDPDERNAEAARMLPAAERDYDIRLSVEQYREIFQRINEVISQP